MFPYYLSCWLATLLACQGMPEYIFKSSLLAEYQQGFHEMLLLFQLLVEKEHEIYWLFQFFLQKTVSLTCPASWPKDVQGLCNILSMAYADCKSTHAVLRGNQPDLTTHTQLPNYSKCSSDRVVLQITSGL